MNLFFVSFETIATLSSAKAIIANLKPFVNNFLYYFEFHEKYFDPIIVKKLKTFFSNISSLYVKFYFCGFLIPIFRKKENTAHTIRTINGTEKESVFVYSTPTNVATQDAGIIIRLVIL